jgi:hypothetical protein
MLLWIAIGGGRRLMMGRHTRSEPEHSKRPLYLRANRSIRHES